jgi:hypothetical protein
MARCLVGWASSTSGQYSGPKLNIRRLSLLLSPRRKNDASTSLRIATLEGMELGLALRLIAPPPCLSRRPLSPPQAFLSPYVSRGSRVCASRLEHGVVVAPYSRMEEDKGTVEEEMEDEDAEPTVSIRPRLELIEKPDRSLALLDEYESEELGTSHCPNHRSG